MRPFTKLDNSIFDYAELVKPAGILIYCYLAKTADDVTRECWPSVKDMQEKLGLAKGTVCTHLALLREYGLIEFREQEDDQRSRIYYLPPVPPLPASAAAKKKRKKGSKSEPTCPVQPDTQAPIGSKSEPVQNMDRSNSWTQIGSKSEPHKEPCTKSQSNVPSERCVPPAPARETSEPKNAGPPQRRREVPDSDHHRLMDAYQNALGYPIPNGALEGKAAKHLLKAGYKVDEIIACYRHFKAREFYQDQHLSLQAVHKNIGAWRLAKQETENGNQDRTQRSANPGDGGSGGYRPAGGSSGARRQDRREREAADAVEELRRIRQQSGAEPLYS